MVTDTPAKSSTPEHAKFIRGFEWLSTPDDALWNRSAEVE
jgi:hypothetical protein